MDSSVCYIERETTISELNYWGTSYLYFTARESSSYQEPLICGTILQHWTKTVYAFAAMWCQTRQPKQLIHMQFRSKLFKTCIEIKKKVTCPRKIRENFDGVPLLLHTCYLIHSAKNITKVNFHTAVDRTDHVSQGKLTGITKMCIEWSINMTLKIRNRNVSSCWV